MILKLPLHLRPGARPLHARLQPAPYHL